MEWKSEEYEAADSRKRRSRLRLRCHSPAEGLTTGKKWQVRRKPRGLGGCSADRGMTQRRWIRPPGASFHVRELIAQRGNAERVEFHGDGSQEGMLHAGAGPVRQDETTFGIRWTQQQSGDAVRIADADRYGFCG